MSFLSSIRARLAVISAIVIAAVLAIAGLGLFFLFQSYLEHRVNEELKDRLLDVAGSIEELDGGSFTMSRPPSDPRYRNPYGGAYWYVREGDAVVLRSRSLWDTEIARPAEPPSSPDYFMSATGPDGAGVYLMERQVSFGEGDAEKRLVLGVALAKGEVQALASSLATVMAAALSAMGLLLFAGAWLQASYGLRPLGALRRQLAGLRKGDQGKLEGPFPAEVAELASDLNALFLHQKELIAKARERAGTLAHGLKTPMTILAGEASRLERDGQAERARAIREHLATIQAQLDRELSRARLQGQASGVGLYADVSATAERIVSLMKRMPKGEAIDWRLPQPGVNAAIDPDDCGELIGNLLDNARKWARNSVEIDAKAQEDGRIIFSVSDDGPGIPEELRSLAVARGERLKEAEAGSGLGLAIVSDILAGYGARLVIGESSQGGLCVSFTLKGASEVA